MFYYVLAEAEELETGKRLGPLGSVVMAESIVGLIRGDPSSILNRRPLWNPTEAGMPSSIFEFLDSAQESDL